MKVAIDTGPLTSGDKIRGVGFYTKELVSGLERESRRDKNLQVFKLDSNSIREQAHKFDIVHIPYFNPFFETVPTGLKSRLVITVHDVIPLLYPSKYPAGAKGKIRLYKQIRALYNVDVVITDSEASKKDIVRFLNVDKNKIIPIHLAPANHFRKIASDKLKTTVKKYGLPTKFVLYVGDINYSKNVLSLIEAVKIAELPIVLVGKQVKEIDNYDTNIMNLDGPKDWIRYLFGKPHPEVSHYQNIINAMNKANVIRLGFVSDEDLVSIYNLATVYCQPSLAEGFGLPVLEAMACGTPVVASHTQALVEIAEGGAVFVDPKDIKDIAQKLKQLFTSPKLAARVSKNGLAKVRKYSWEQTVAKTLEVYKNIL